MTTTNTPVIDAQSNPIADIKPTQYDVAPFRCVVAYARSADADSLNEYNQDAFALRVAPQRLVAVVADGVGQSFRGDVAAMAVAQSIMQVLWQAESLNDIDVRETLKQKLVELAPRVTQMIDDVDLSQHPTMFREALMQRRAFGSESVFAALAIDIPTNMMRCFWLGDCRIRIYNHAGKSVALDTTLFQTMERWSSTRIIHGKLHALQMPVSQLSRVVLYSDGLQSLDTLPLMQPDLTTTVASHMSTSRTSPESDDITLIMVDVRQ